MREERGVRLTETETETERESERQRERAQDRVLSQPNTISAGRVLIDCRSYVQK
jgi:hypothetical protein